MKGRNRELYDEIEDALAEISKDLFCCRNVRKRLIPKKYVRKYGINNLWIYNLRDGWRLLYSVVNPSKIEVLAIVLEWMDHKSYERLFGF
ncbi:MAG: hypothetical protein JXB14_00630 [Candidatus Altiarchaeota archaeon]|nr:hypothetical protein [Candidatus Altiarchaeota archaeon]